VAGIFGGKPRGRLRNKRRPGENFASHVHPLWKGGRKDEMKIPFLYHRCIFNLSFPPFGEDTDVAKRKTTLGLKENKLSSAKDIPSELWNAELNVWFFLWAQLVFPYKIFLPDGQCSTSNRSVFFEKEVEHEWPSGKILRLAGPSGALWFSISLALLKGKIKGPSQPEGFSTNRIFYFPPPGGRNNSRFTW